MIQDKKQEACVLPQETQRTLPKSIRALHSLWCSGCHHRLLRRWQAIPLRPPDHWRLYRPISQRNWSSSSWCFTFIAFAFWTDLQQNRPTPAAAAEEPIANERRKFSNWWEQVLDLDGGVTCVEELERVKERLESLRSELPEWINRFYTASCSSSASSSLSSAAACGESVCPAKATGTQSGQLVTMADEDEWIYGELSEIDGACYLWFWFCISCFLSVLVQWFVRCLETQWEFSTCNSFLWRGFVMNEYFWVWLKK